MASTEVTTRTDGVTCPRSLRSVSKPGTEPLLLENWPPTPPADPLLLTPQDYTVINRQTLTHINN